jgi:hypothetical protein
MASKAQRETRHSQLKSLVLPTLDAIRDEFEKAHELAVKEHA